MTEEFLEDKNVDDEENKLGYDGDIFDIEIEFDNEVIKRIERTDTKPHLNNRINPFTKSYAFY